MFRRVVFGAIWCFVLYIAACGITRAVAAAIADSHHPATTFGEGYAAGQHAGAQAVAPLRSYFPLAAISISIVGTWLRILPGTRTRKPLESPA